MSKVLEAGDSAPQFDLPADGGRRVALSDLKGKKVVLYFYPKDDTTGCTAEAIAFSGMKPKFEAAGAVVIGVSPDNPKSHDRFKTKHDLQFALASDETRAMLEAYGVWVEKSMYGKKYMGVERTTFLIDANGQIAKIWRKVKVPGHAEAALEAAKAI